MARPLVPDELWEVVQPLLPRHRARPGKRGRPPAHRSSVASPTRSTGRTSNGQRTGPPSPLARLGGCRAWGARPPTSPAGGAPAPLRMVAPPKHSALAAGLPDQHPVCPLGGGHSFPASRCPLVDCHAPDRQINHPRVDPQKTEKHCAALSGFASAARLIGRDRLLNVLGNTLANIPKVQVLPCGRKKHVMAGRGTSFGNLPTARAVEGGHPHATILAISGQGHPAPRPGFRTARRAARTAAASGAAAPRTPGRASQPFHVDSQNGLVRTW
jgi:hypothetical protein